MDRESTRMLLQQWTFSIHRMHRHDSIYAARLLFVYFNNEESKFRRNMIIPLLCLLMALITCCTCLTGTKICLHSVRVSIEISRATIWNWFMGIDVDWGLECVYTRMLSLDTTARLVNKKILWKQKLIQNSPHILVSPTRTVSECSPNICWQCWRFHVVNPIQLPQNNQLSSDNIASRSFWFPNVWWPISGWRRPLLN